MKIVSLQAENVKRLRAVEITPDPDGNTVVIAGRNGQGKTSVLDSIWFALGGGPAAKTTSRPIRDGETSASVTLDLGELKVTRTWTADRTALKVENADGARYSSPQAMLDGLVGRLSFDPLSFAQQDERAQLATLLDLIDLPYDPAELAAKRRGLYEERTQVGRDVKQLTGQLAGAPTPAAGLPEQELSAADILTRARQAQQWQQRAADVVREHERAVARRRTAQAELEAAVAAETEAERTRDSIPADLPDPAVFEAELAQVEQTNAAIRDAQARRAVEQRLAAAKYEHDRLSEQLQAIDLKKTAALAAATMPIEGLGFDDDGVTYQGVPFKQASAAEQLRVSVAMAMALNPKVRVIRITDGSLLDSSNLAVIEQMAADRDFQVWIERVDETGQVGILIEDGQVRAAAAEPVPA